MKSLLTRAGKFLTFLLPAAFLELSWWLNGQTGDLSRFLLILVWSGAILLLAYFLARFPRVSLAFLLISGIVIGLAYPLIPTISAYWIAGSAYAVLLWAFGFQKKKLGLLLCLLGAVLAGLLLEFVIQIEVRFSDEEFFAAFQAFIFVIFWLLLVPAWYLICPPSSKTERPAGRLISRGVFLLVTLGLGILAFKSYQQSFYTSDVTLYPGIDSQQPFLCEVLPSASTSVRSYNGEDVHNRLIALIEADDTQSTLHQAQLAALKGDPKSLQTFRDTLLKEAEAGLYTGPSNSVKYGQYEAAQRLYYYLSISEKHPELFSGQEKETLKAWFNAINRRALTVEWVDWMYATAFSEWPNGPYLNQEIGAGFLSLMEWGGMSSPELSTLNQQYLAKHPGGWQLRFRNNDDSLGYELEWIANAFFQEKLNPLSVEDMSRVQQSFSWLLLQALPDGAPYGYNPSKPSLAAMAYFAAERSGDPRYLWLAGRAVEYLEENGLSLNLNPTLSGPVAQKSTQPEFGSCLLYGDSGLPTQVGPLAPDKIVYRDGWSDQSKYLMLNLRFTGWHRYKATNSVVSLYQSEPLVYEKSFTSYNPWLPAGRALLRDKRLPRENLNGLVVERQGFSKLGFELTGIDGFWAQDPPFYATVESFSTGPEMDSSVTTIEDWQGWRQRRSIYFVHDGPIVVLDEATGPSESQAAITWHVIGAFDEARQVAWLGSAKQMTLQMLSPDSGELQSVATQFEGKPAIDLTYLPTETGRLRTATVFLPEAWKNASVQILSEGDGFQLQIKNQGQTLVFP